MKPLSDYTPKELNTLYKCVAEAFGRNGDNRLNDYDLTMWLYEIKLAMKESEDRIKEKI